MPEAVSQIEVSLLIPCHKCADDIGNTVQTCQALLERLVPHSYEIILVPNGVVDTTFDRCREIAESSGGVIRNVPRSQMAGKGVALREGGKEARGRWIFFTDADLPYDLNFFGDALEQLRSGAGLVTGNRRLSDSTFTLPADLLAMTHLRHEMGRFFNFCVRILFPIDSRDTQAGIKAIATPLARIAFDRQASEGFFFDVELFLVAKRWGFTQQDLPVYFTLRNSNSTVRLFRDSIRAFLEIMRIYLRDRWGHYSPSTEQPLAPKLSS